MPPDGKCDIAYVGTGRQLAINFNSADGRFLQQGKIEDLDADVAIAAVATKIVCRIPHFVGRFRQSGRL